MGKRKVTSDITKTKSLDLSLDLSNLPNVEDTTPLISRDKIGGTFDIPSMTENEAVGFASKDRKFSSELTGEDDAQNKVLLDLE